MESALKDVISHRCSGCFPCDAEVFVQRTNSRSELRGQSVVKFIHSSGGRLICKSRRMH